MTQVSYDDDPVSLWASARVTELLADHDEAPRYGTREWRELANGDPRKAASMITAAEMWRRYGDEDELVAWLHDAYRNRDSLASRRTMAELDAFARPKPAVPVNATPGWPPVAIPGRPGWYRHLVDGQQVDRPRAGVAA
ncbi:DUF2742 domain-containing protein [Streptomyces sp. W16]|uniref:DUF2742 domain-containing protein n=1 Tax=Streptomyces sp. W16 TaxID=3076631 RepID=UPI00295AD112|nr:DUF2742 domain-containing protein [Streptomyces sp. W16]MDV9168730.1 DUF2742 domain-containing protein [Streptomyces sp. W16]